MAVSPGLNRLGIALAAGAVAALSLSMSAAPKKSAGGVAPVPLSVPLGLRFGMSPQEAQSALAGRQLRFVGPAAPASLDELLHEQRWEGEVLGKTADQVAPMFFGGRLFGLAVSWSPTPADPATGIWEAMVERLAATYGRPARLSRPVELMSAAAVLALLPPDVDRNALLAVYNKVAGDPVLGRYFLLDLEVMARVWVPDAQWRFADGSQLRVAMRASGGGPAGLSGLKPVVVWVNPSQFQ